MLHAAPSARLTMAAEMGDEVLMDRSGPQRYPDRPRRRLMSARAHGDLTRAPLLESHPDLIPSNHHLPR